MRLVWGLAGPVRTDRDRMDDVPGAAYSGVHGRLAADGPAGGLGRRAGEDVQMTSLREQLISRGAAFGVEDQPLPGRDGGFSSLCHDGKAFAHFHHDNELDIRLTKAVIRHKG